MPKSPRASSFQDGGTAGGGTELRAAVLLADLTVLGGCVDMSDMDPWQSSWYLGTGHGPTEKGDGPEHCAELGTQICGTSSRLGPTWRRRGLALASVP